MSVETAIVSRWSDASLDSTVASLYIGEDESAPKAGDMPRASFVCEDEFRHREESVGYREMTAPFTFTVWAATAVLAVTYRTAIENAFDNAHNASSNPFTLSSGTVLYVTYQGSSLDSDTPGVCRLTMRFECVYTKAQVVPA